MNAKNSIVSNANYPRVREQFCSADVSGQKVTIAPLMSQLKRQYLDLNYDSHYTIDDYVILAKR